MKDVTQKNVKGEKFSNKIKDFSSNHKAKSRWKMYFIFLIIILVYYYLNLPPIHYAAIEFWIFLALICVGIIIIEFINDIQKNTTADIKPTSMKKMSLKYKMLIYPWPFIIIIGLLSQLILSPVFFAKNYANMLKIEDASFEKDFPETDLNQIPLIDRDTAIRLGNRKLGSLTSLVSQFEVSEDYTQINISGKPYRVTPLQYAGFFKWVNNFQKGIPHYLLVDTVTGNVEVKTPAKPIKYSYADKFNRNIFRHLRFNYPFSLFSEPSFEVDDNGNPYYIATTYKRNFFIKEPEASGVVTVNAMTGETKKYSLKNTPTWIDRVYSSDLILHQMKMNGLYKNGFWNSVFSKTGVTEPTEGYNYIPMNDDLYLYTGITSVSADESNIGFVLVNLRTKEAKQYTVDAAEEFSAMKSAEGSVQETEYSATFPLLINIQGKPMYILTLKDNSGLIRKYALVDVSNYSKVYVESSVDKLLATYSQDNSVKLDKKTDQIDTKEIEGIIDEVQAVVVDGQTVYYFMISGDVYRAPVKLNEKLPFISAGQTIKIKVSNDGEVAEIIKISE